MFWFRSSGLSRWGIPMTARHDRIAPPCGPAWLWEDLAFLAVGGAYSLMFWVWQSGLSWRALQQLL